VRAEIVRRCVGAGRLQKNANMAPAAAARWLLLVWAVAAAAAQETYPIDWNAVPVTQPAALDTRNRDIGPCVCDLTAGECDGNCRCDADCSAAERATFSGAEPEGPVSLRKRRCVDPKLIEVNKRGGISSTVVDNLLCLEADNSDSRGLFFVDPGTPSTADFEQIRLAYRFTFQPSRVAPTPSRNRYAVGDVVGGALRSSPTTLEPATLGLFPLPTRGFTAACSERGGFFFRRDVPSGPGARCLRNAASLAADCASNAFDGNAYLTRFAMARTPASRLDQPAQWVTLTLASIASRSAATGALTALPLGGGVPAPAYAAGVCQNALASVALRISYNDDGEVTAAAADVVVTDAAERADGSASLEQEFTARFVSTTARPRSGNPGYRYGLPVLAGAVATQGGRSAISQLQSGLQVARRAASGECSATGAVASTVVFGYDAVYSCHVSLTQAQLQAFCGNAGLQSLFNLTLSTHFGMFGNADLSVVSQWAPFAIDTPSSGSWDSITDRCSGLQNSMNIEFVVVNLGSVLNPQRKLAAARVRFSSTDTWQFTLESPAAAQQFPILTTVTFVPYPASAISELIPPNPPAFPKLPRDVLYPFYVDGSAAHAAAPPLAAARAVALAAISLALLALRL
jgi:hypothetical protein